MKHSRTSMSPQAEYRWVLVFAAVVMLVTTIPILLGYSAQAEDWQFTGFVLSVEDGNGFVAKMLSGTAGDWLFRTPYTAFPQRGFLIFLPYLLLGKLVPAPGTHEQLVALFHLFRVCAGLAAILATYRFLSLFITTVYYRRWGVVLAALGGGLGWLLILAHQENWLGSLPLEFYSPESFGFLSLYVYPHYALARALLLWTLAAYLQATARLDDSRNIAWEGIKVAGLWLLTSLAQPVTGLVLGVVLGAYLFMLAIWQVWLRIRHERTEWVKLWRMGKLALWAGLLPVPFLLYNLVSSQLDPFLKAWLEQSTFRSPNPLHYLLAYGLILPFAIIGAKHLWQAENWTAKLPVLWAALLPVLAYAPIGIQRRLPDGIWVALVILAMKALETTRDRRIQRAGTVLLLALPSTVVLLVIGALVAVRPAEPAFLPLDEVAAFESVAEVADRDEVVLASYESGNAVPAWAPVFVVVGYGPESVHAVELMPRVEAFYQTDTQESERIKLLRELDVDFVLWGPNERKLGGWDPRMAAFLVPFSRFGDYWVFAVR